MGSKERQNDTFTQRRFLPLMFVTVPRMVMGSLGDPESGLTDVMSIATSWPDDSLSVP